MKKEVVDLNEEERLVLERRINKACQIISRDFNLGRSTEIENQYVIDFIDLYIYPSQIQDLLISSLKSHEVNATIIYIEIGNKVKVIIEIMYFDVRD